MESLSSSSETIFYIAPSLTALLLWGENMYDFSKKEVFSATYATHRHFDESALIYKDKDAYERALSNRGTVSYADLYTSRPLSDIKVPLREAFVNCAAELSKKYLLDLVVNQYRDRVSAVFSDENEIVVTELEPLLSMADEISVAYVNGTVRAEFSLYLYEK